jgi:hypothetical protein
VTWEQERKKHDEEIEARKARAARREKKRRKAKRERQAAINRRRHEQKRKAGHRDVTGPASCPRCGDGDRLYTIEAITGYARATAQIENGVIHFAHEGKTEFDYDSSTTIGVGCDCGWRGMATELVLAR